MHPSVLFVIMDSWPKIRRQLSLWCVIGRYFKQWYQLDSLNSSSSCFQIDIPIPFAVMRWLTIICGHWVKFLGPRSGSLNKKAVIWIPCVENNDHCCSKLTLNRHVNSRQIVIHVDVTKCAIPLPDSIEADYPVPYIVLAPPVLHANTLHQDWVP